MLMKQKVVDRYKLIYTMPAMKGGPAQDDNDDRN